MEQEPLTKSGPDGTVTDLSADVLHCGDWLAVIYDQNWWLANAVSVDTHHQDVKVFFHPHGPNTQFYPKGGGYVLHTIQSHSCKTCGTVITSLCKQGKGDIQSVC